MVEKTLTVHDTIKEQIIKTVQVPVTQTITIADPCDSLGILRAFKQTIKTPKASITIEGKDGALTASVNMDSIFSVWEKTYKSKAVVNTEKVTITKYKHYKFTWYILGALMLSLAYIFKRFIPILKFLPF